MGTPQMKLARFVAVFRRRWRLVVVATAIVALFCILGAFVLPTQFESSTTILFRPDKTLNPISGYDLMLLVEDQFRNFDEVIFSRTLLDAAVDSLRISGQGSGKEMTRDALIAEVRGKISTRRLGSDSFRITFSDSDPRMAKRGAEVVAALFIQKKISVQTRESALAVQFYEEKVAEYRSDFESSLQSILVSVRQRVQELPMETRGLYVRMEEAERDIQSVSTRISSLKDKPGVMSTLAAQFQQNPMAFRREGGKQPLYDLERAEIPFSAEITRQVDRYDDLTRRFNSEYPDVIRAEAELADLLVRAQVATENELIRLNTRLSQLERRRSEIVMELQASSVGQQQSQEKQSSFDMKRRLYEETKLKLEQARLAHEVSERGANQFVILDPAIVPAMPAKPNRPLIIIAGFVLGFFLGMLAALVAELFDTTIRVPEDVEVFHKPIIAFLPEDNASARHNV